jgi:hypothetical protein
MSRQPSRAAATSRYTNHGSVVKLGSMKTRGNSSDLKKKRAIELRLQGYSYREILGQVNVSMSSLSLWLRDIRLTEDQKDRLREKGNVHRILGGQRTRLKWQNLKIEALSDYIPPIENPRFMLGLGLYWGEGRKTETHVAIGNTCPRILRIFIAWIREFFPGEFERFSVSVQHHWGAGKDCEVIAYWSDELGLEVRDFTKCVHILPRNDRPLRKFGFGIAYVAVRGSAVWRICEKIRITTESIAFVV